jgi:hypothetical protein
MTKAEAERVDALALQILEMVDVEPINVAGEALVFAFVNLVVKCSGSKEVGESLYESIQDAAWAIVEEFGMLPANAPQCERPERGTVRAWGTRGLFKVSTLKAKSARKSETALRVKAAGAGTR